MIITNKIIQITEVKEKIGVLNNLQEPERIITSYYLSNGQFLVALDPKQHVIQQLLQQTQKDNSQPKPKVETQTGGEVIIPDPKPN